MAVACKIGLRRMKEGLGGAGRQNDGGRLESGRMEGETQGGQANGAQLRQLLAPSLFPTSQPKPPLGLLCSNPLSLHVAQPSAHS